MRTFPRISEAIGLVIAKTVLVIAFSIPGWILTPDESTIQRVAELLARALAFGLIIWWGCRRAGVSLRELLSGEPFRVTRVLAVVLMVAGAVCLAIGVSFALQAVWPKPDSMKESVLQLHGGNLLLTFLGAMVVGPVAEELLFRGLILQGFLRNYSRRKAIVVSALLFGLSHFNPWQIPIALLLGIVLGWLRAQGGSLLSCVLAHALANSPPVFFGVLGLVLGSNPSAHDRGAAGPTWPEVLVVSLVGMGFLAIGVILAWRTVGGRRRTDSKLRVGSPGPQQRTSLD